MEKITIGIVGSGPEGAIPDLLPYDKNIDLWIGADRGALYLLKHKLNIDYAVGDFDSVTADEIAKIRENTKEMIRMPSEKDETDLELAINLACKLKPETICLFGVTAGRKDHELINIQLLYRLLEQGLTGKIIDEQNEIIMTKPGSYLITRNPEFPYISFIPFTEKVEGIHLEGFYYPLNNADISWGSTLCISNELSSESGNFSYRRGILLLIKSRDSFKM